MADKTQTEQISLAIVQTIWVQKETINFVKFLVTFDVSAPLVYKLAFIGLARWLSG